MAERYKVRPCALTAHAGCAWRPHEWIRGGFVLLFMDDLTMSARLLEEVRQFLPDLESTQREFSNLFLRKREALIAARSDELLRLADSETVLVKRLHSHLGRRQRILIEARSEGLPSDSIVNLVARIAGEEIKPLETRIERIRILSLRLRRESWIHWIISHRTYNHYSEILNLIAHCGEQAPTYSRDKNEEKKSTGGAILDTSI